VARLGLASILLLAAASARAQQQVVPGQLLNLSCLEALVTVDHKELMGIFSFVAEKDEPQAFGDFLTHDKKAMKKFVAKVAQDLKAASGVSAWDREALKFTLVIYGSPLRSTVPDPGPKMMAEIMSLSAAPVVPLEAIEAARRKG